MFWRHARLIFGITGIWMVVTSQIFSWISSDISIGGQESTRRFAVLELDLWSRVFIWLGTVFFLAACAARSPSK